MTKAQMQTHFCNMYQSGRLTRTAGDFLLYQIRCTPFFKVDGVCFTQGFCGQLSTAGGGNSERQYYQILVWKTLCSKNVGLTFK